MGHEYRYSSHESAGHCWTVCGNYSPFDLGGPEESAFSPASPGESKDGGTTGGKHWPKVFTFWGFFRAPDYLCLGPGRCASGCQLLLAVLGQILSSPPPLSLQVEPLLCFAEPSFQRTGLFWISNPLHPHPARTPGSSFWQDLLGDQETERKQNSTRCSELLLVKVPFLSSLLFIFYKIKSHGGSFPKRDGLSVVVQGTFRNLKLLNTWFVTFLFGNNMCLTKHPKA